MVASGARSTPLGEHSNSVLGLNRAASWANYFGAIQAPPSSNEGLQRQPPYEVNRMAKLFPNH